MTYISLEYYILVIVSLIVYYFLPVGRRWLALLAGSAVFYYFAASDIRQYVLFVCTIALSFAGALWIEAVSEPKKKKIILWGVLLAAAAPLLVMKVTGILQGHLREGFERIPLIVPVGLSFYTLQIISYLADVYGGKIRAQRNPFKYALFISFFPQIIQGPIPRYEQLGGQLFEGRSFSIDAIVRGSQRILWGFFLKLMIADKAAVAVNEIFNNYGNYEGAYVWVAGILYSIQLYTDFLACTTIAQGVAELFGIEIVDNFRHPYFAVSVQDFWRRWHRSLSEWLRDYVYIPLGGNRKGTVRKYINLCITFLVSGLWHGEGIRFLFWGGLHAFYQIFGTCTAPLRNRVCEMIKLSEGTFSRRLFQTLGTCFWVMTAWIIFRANSLRSGLHMIRSMLTVFNPWVLLNGSLDSIMPYQEWVLLSASILVLFFVSRAQKKGSVRDRISEQHLTIRWGLALACIAIIMIFGTYGFGYDAQAFIYGGF